MPDDPVRDRWSPPRRFPGRAHVWSIMALCVVLAGASMYLQPDPFGTMSGQYPDEYIGLDTMATAPMPYDTAALYPVTTDPATATPAPEPIVSREEEAIAAGFAMVQSWTESAQEANTTQPVSVAAEPGYSYMVLARTIPGCDVDLYIQDDLLDSGSGTDAQLVFWVQQAAQVLVELRMFGAGTCPVAYGIYRTAQEARP